MQESLIGDLLGWFDWLISYQLFNCICISGFLFIGLSCHQNERPDENDSIPPFSQAEIQKGQNIFKLQCVRCHGIAGSGGSAPSLRRSRLPRAPDDESLHKIIKYGIPGTEMPGSWMLTAPDVKLVAAYVRSIGKVIKSEIAGDVDEGKVIYNSQGGCKLCHIIDGGGGSLGPDLTRIGSRRSAEFLERSLIEPGFYKKEGEMTNSANGFINNLICHVKTKSGVEVKGIRVNEDAFTIQIKDAQNQFHSFQKQDLEEIRKEYEKSLMPSVKGILNELEVDHLVAYLASLN